VDLDLAGKGILVTGGSGGIGSATARAFAAEGARVVIQYNTGKERAENLTRECGGIALQADLTRERDADALCDGAVDALGRVDVLVACAGRWPARDEPVWDMSYERWRATMAVDLDSVFLSCRAFLRHLATTGTGNIVMIGSTAGSFGESGHADYAAAKSAVAGGLLNSLKNEIVRVAPRGRVNVVSPGWTRTDMTRNALMDPSLEDRITRTMALRKLGRAEDVARAVVMLASDVVSGHVTGQVLTVAGGMEGRVLHEPS
jgi:3-oxoacyl-[acyl-carrier protein] reductase